MYILFSNDCPQLPFSEGSYLGCTWCKNAYDFSFPSLSTKIDFSTETGKQTNKQPQPPPPKNLYKSQVKMIQET